MSPALPSEPGLPRLDIRKLAAPLLAQFQRAPAAVVRRRATRLALIVACGMAAWLVVAAGAHGYTRLTRRDHPSQWFPGRTSADRGLVVLVHGWTKGPESMGDAASVVANQPEYRDFGINLWGYDAARFSNSDPLLLAERLGAHIEEIGGDKAPEIVLIGHSLGGLLVRRSYLNAAIARKPWAAAVSRIVLLAAPNRGSQATSRSRLLWLGDAVARSMGLGRLIRSIYRGSPFIVNLRIEWIRQFGKTANPPVVAQLVGGRDAEVSTGDSNDVVQFPTAVQRTLPGSTHESILRKDESGFYLKQLLLAPRIAPAQPAVNPQSVFKVLLAHGIRDYGERFDDISDALQTLAGRRQLTVLTSAPRYRYFSALEFINPFSRRLKVYEFADLYAELLATAPVDAPINFVGHSFGTFLMGESTKLYEAIAFDRVFLAGSVLREDFFADRMILGQRIQYLRNDIATKDWPVGILCSALDGLRLANDVGTGGFNGFTGIASPNLLEEIRYFDGGHGAALEDANRQTIAEWLFQSAGASTYDRSRTKEMLREAGVLVPERDFVWSLASRAAPGLLILLFAGVGYLMLFCQRPWVVLAEVLAVAWLLNII